MRKYLAYTIAMVFFCIGTITCRPSTSSVDDENKLHFLYFPTPEEQVEIVFNDTNSLRAANLKPATKTIFLIDGFTAPPVTPMTWETKNTFTGRTDTNVIIVDWSAYSGNGRPIATPEDFLDVYFEVLFKEIPKAAEDLADFINFLSAENGISFDNVVLIGHSLGCHTVGYTGRTVISKYGKPVSRIIGLDSAVQVSEYDGQMRLRTGDASVVEAYITNRKYVGDASHTLGDISIFVNGGDDQPCQFISKESKIVDNAGDIGIQCDSHGFSWKFYNYMPQNETLKACPCKGAACFCQGCSMECGEDGINVGPNIPEEARGAYHVKTGFLDWGL